MSMTEYISFVIYIFHDLLSSVISININFIIFTVSDPAAAADGEGERGVELLRADAV